MKIHKKLPPGTKLSSGFDRLSIWGDRMAMVDSGYGYDEDGDTYFDPVNLAQRYVVYLSDVPAHPSLLDVRYDSKFGNKTFWEQPFYYRRVSDWHASQGQFEPPFDYWLQLDLKDLGPKQTRRVLETLREKGYAEASWNYPLPAKTWQKLLGMTIEETQEGDSTEANAADDVDRRHSWDQLAGVYGLTKKGTIKFIVSRKASKQGL